MSGLFERKLVQVVRINPETIKKPTCHELKAAEIQSYITITSLKFAADDLNKEKESFMVRLDKNLVVWPH